MWIIELLQKLFQWARGDEPQRAPTDEDEELDEEEEDEEDEDEERSH